MLTDDQAKFAELMSDAQRAAIELDGISRDGSKEMARVVRAGLRVYSRLLDFRQTVRMDVVQTDLLQTALDLLWARLRFFGEPV